MKQDQIENQGLDIVRDFQFVKQVSTQSLGELIYAYLKRKIMRGDISDEQRLGEGELVKTLGVSRTPIRHALERLEQERFTRKLSYGGYEIRRLTRRDIEEIFGVRSVLESYAASLAARQITQGTLRKLEQIIDRSRIALEKDDVDEAIELNTKFHDSLYRASGSEQLYYIIQNLGDYLYRYRKIILLQKSNREDSLRDHETMIRAIAERNQDSVEGLVKEHVMRALKVVLRELDKGK
jgi:DNA-binding GntR family transcriptional regulator